ncbi:MAG: KpsF/GutQ family sugar-phosphate isomerase [Magnetospirillum sp. WYHS-4]
MDSTLSSGDRDLASARRVLKLEAAALDELAASLGEAFVAAVGILEGIRGRVVVTGMGKSGHVARKIAATMASTGTPAFFVHPGEASHGDLGMITGEDAVIALSNSGETAELGDMVAYACRFDIPLIALTRKPSSALAKAATVALVLPPSDEACPMGLAPTTSTTAMLALGDALAVALLERKNFSSDDFQVFHPGGKLGQRLLKVADIMHQGDQLPLVDRGTPMHDALLTMTAKRLGCVGVLDGEGRLLGIVTDGDLRRHMGPDLLARKVEDLMTAGPKTISPDALASEAVRIMNKKAITTLFVLVDGRPEGILHIHDCLRAGVV